MTVSSHPQIELQSRIDLNDQGNIRVNQPGLIQKWLSIVERRLLREQLAARVHIGVVDPSQVSFLNEHYSQHIQQGCRIAVWSWPQAVRPKSEHPLLALRGERFLIVEHIDYAWALLSAGRQYQMNSIIVTNPEVVHGLSRYLQALEMELKQRAPSYTDSYLRCRILGQ